MDQFEQSSFAGKSGLAPGRALSYYRVLDVDPQATRIEIREAYLRLKNTYGAGSAALYSLISEEEAMEQMALVEEAFRVLNDDVSRRDYDAQAGLGKAGRQGAALASFAREQANLSALPTWRDGQAAICEPGARAARTPLPVIKLKATGVGTEEMNARLQALLEDADPGDGDLFRRLREAAGVSEDEMQERTKICISYIQAIESNRFERLPQAVYVKGFLRSYCRYLCVPDAEKVVAAFSARLTDWQANRKA